MLRDSIVAIASSVFALVGCKAAAPGNQVKAGASTGTSLGVAGYAVDDLAAHCTQLGMAVVSGIAVINGLGPVDCLVYGGKQSAVVDIKATDLLVADGKLLYLSGEEAVFDEFRVLHRSDAGQRNSLPVIWCARIRKNTMERTSSGVMVVAGSARYLAMMISAEFEQSTITRA